MQFIFSFNELIEAKQDGQETVSTYLNRIAELDKELQEAGQSITEELIAAIAVIIYMSVCPTYVLVRKEWTLGG